MQDNDHPTRTALIQAALRQFGREGFEAASTRAIAAGSAPNVGVGGSASANANGTSTSASGSVNSSSVVNGATGTASNATGMATGAANTATGKVTGAANSAEQQAAQQLNQPRAVNGSATASGNMSAH